MKKKLLPQESVSFALANKHKVVLINLSDYTYLPLLVEDRPTKHLQLAKLFDTHEKAFNYQYNRQYDRYAPVKIGDWFDLGEPAQILAVRHEDIVFTLGNLLVDPKTTQLLNKPITSTTNHIWFVAYKGEGHFKEIAGFACLNTESGNTDFCLIYPDHRGNNILFEQIKCEIITYKSNHGIV